MSGRANALVRPWRLVALVPVVAVVLALVGAGVAQTGLRVDGRDVGEVRTDLVPGSAYAPLDRLAAGMGARLAAPVGAERAVMTLGGHVVTVEVVSQGDDPRRPGAVRRDAAPAGDLAAIRGDDAVWGPVAPLVRALGGEVGFLPDQGAVVVVTPRATVASAELTGDGTLESLRLRLDAPVSWTRFDDEDVGRSELLLRRARLSQARTLRGERMTRVDLIPEDDGVRVRIEAPGSVLEVIALADGDATDLRVRARARDEGAGDEAAETADDGPRIALDPSPGGDASVLALARAVAERLRADGAETELTHDGPAPVTAERRLAVAAGAELFVTLAPADLPAGEVRIWVLGEAGEAAALELAVRRNAAAALAAGEVDALRRELLLGLVPDLEVGRRAGRAIASALFQLGGYRAGEVGEAPLTGLAPAAGRGVLIEIGRGDLGSPELPEVLAAALRSAAGGAR